MGREPVEDTLERLLRRVATGSADAPLPHAFPEKPLATECSTVLRALERDPEGHEAHALVLLLGGSLERLGLSPLHVGRLGAALHEALGAPAVPAPLDLSALLFEGYARSQEEAFGEACQQRLDEAQAMFQWAFGCFAWLPRGALQSDRIEACGERFARMLWRARARAALVDPSGLTVPVSEALPALRGVLDLLRTAGCPVFLPRPSEGSPWRVLLEEAHPGLIPCDGLQEAFRAAERRAGLRLLRWPPFGRH